MEWQKLTRAEKIEHLYDYPFEERHEKVEELWGEKASICAEHVVFPHPTAWDDLVTLLKKTGYSQMTYLHLTEKDFKQLTPDDWRRDWFDADAFIDWQNEVMKEEERFLEFSLYDDDTLLCNVCTKNRGYGDSDGYGMEPSSWACALFDLNGNVIRPFAPGYQWSKLRR